MTESLTEEGEGRIFQWSRIKSLWQSSKQLLGYQGSLIAAIPTVHSARYITFKLCSSCPYKNEFYETLANISRLYVQLE